MYQFLAAIALFLVGLRLSAFFSGTETGFYRASAFRLAMDADAGDRVAERILWFVRHPANFVATSLVGNNVANYVTTLAVGLGVTALVGSQTGAAEVVSTLLISPIIFVFGELLPKHRYYTAPLQLLRRDVRWYSLFYRLFLVCSFPLIWATRAIEKLGGSEENGVQAALNRSRLVQILSQGHQEGLLSEIQSRLIHGLLHNATLPVVESMTPAARVLGVAEGVSRDTLLSFASRHGLSFVPIHRAGRPTEWFQFARVIDVAVSNRPVDADARRMPRIKASATKLDALLILRRNGAAVGAVCRNRKVIGTINEHGLLEQLFRSAQPIQAGSRADAQSVG